MSSKAFLTLLFRVKSKNECDFSYPTRFHFSLIQNTKYKKYSMCKHRQGDRKVLGAPLCEVESPLRHMYSVDVNRTKNRNQILWNVSESTTFAAKENDFTLLIFKFRFVSTNVSILSASTLSFCHEIRFFLPSEYDTGASFDMSAGSEERWKVADGQRNSAKLDGVSSYNDIKLLRFFCNIKKM